MAPRRISLSEVGRLNTVYSDAEQIAIKNGLKTTEASLLRLSTLRSNGEATHRRLVLKDQIHRCQVALAPFKKIPKEIWMYIFELYCQSGRLSTCDIEQSPPVVLTQMCSAWRQIALSMPKLWSDVYLDGDLDEDLDLARMWLERAGNIPRDLETSTPPSSSSGSYYCPSSNRPHAIQTFIRSFPFRKLHLTQRDAERMDFTAIPVESLLLLEDLALFESKPAWNSPYLGVTSLSPHHLPNLVSLQIDTKSMPRFHVLCPFATWKKLRVLRLKCELDKARCLEILRDASSVEDCSLLLLTFYDQDSTNENVVLANLKILRLSFSFTLALWSFLGHFTFPNLHTLNLIPRASTTTFQLLDATSLRSIAPRIGSLRSLNLHCSWINIDVGLMLECFPLLQVLELHCSKITTHTAKKIGKGELGGCLRELRDWNSSNLFEFLQACELRCGITQGQSGAIASLEKVSVRYSKSHSITCKRRIRKLQKHGVQFEAKYFEAPAD